MNKFFYFLVLALLLSWCAIASDEDGYENLLDENEQIDIKPSITIEVLNDNIIADVEMVNTNDYDFCIPRSMLETDAFYVYDFIKDKDEPIGDIRIHADPALDFSDVKESDYFVFSKGQVINKRFVLSNIFKINEETLYNVHYFNSDFTCDESRVVSITNESVYIIISRGELMQLTSDI